MLPTFKKPPQTVELNQSLNQPKRTHGEPQLHTLLRHQQTEESPISKKLLQPLHTEELLLKFQEPPATEDTPPTPFYQQLAHHTFQHQLHTLPKTEVKLPTHMSKLHLDMKLPPLKAPQLLMVQSPTTPSQPQMDILLTPKLNQLELLPTEELQHTLLKPLQTEEDHHSLNLHQLLLMETLSAIPLKPPQMEDKTLTLQRPRPTNQDKFPL